MSKNNVKPEIRFKNFNDAWEQRKLDKLATFSKGRGYSKSDLLSEGDPIILYGRLYTKYETVIEEVNTYAEKIEGSIISHGDEVIVPASGETSEDISRASVVARSGIIIGGDLNIINTNAEIDSVFLALTISNGTQQKELAKRAQGKSVVHIRNSDLKVVNLQYPNKEEQIKIGIFFKNIDNTIALHQHELTLLKQRKKAFLQKMFPQKGESIPEVRFSKYEDNWQNCKLGDLGSVAMNKRIFKDQTSSEGEIPFYKIGSFGGSPDAYISRALFEEYKSKYPYPNKGDILISASGSIGRTVEYTGADEYFQDSNIVWFNHNNNLSNLFLKQFYNIVKWQGLEGSTIKRLYNRNILNTNIDIPTREEQQKIGQFFKQLDDDIALHEQKLEKLKEMKKAFLQKMFV